jgi:hypothetical protein
VLHLKIFLQKSESNKTNKKDDLPLRSVRLIDTSDMCSMLGKGLDDVQCWCWEMTKASCCQMIANSHEDSCTRRNTVSKIDQRFCNRVIRPVHSKLLIVLAAAGLSAGEQFDSLLVFFTKAINKAIQILRRHSPRAIFPRLNPILFQLEKKSKIFRKKRNFQKDFLPNFGVDAQDTNCQKVGETTHAASESPVHTLCTRCAHHEIDT